jgi:hypothetical protein
MAKDPLSNVAPGQSAREVIYSSARHNAYANAARWVQAHTRGTMPGSGFSASDSCLIHVLNDSGEKRGQYEVLAIDGLAITPTENLDDFLAHPIAKGVKPKAEHLGKFVVLQQPLDQAEVGLGLVAGVTIVQLNTQNGAGPYADIAPGDAATLTADWRGGAEVLWWGGGEVDWAVIRVGVWNQMKLQGIAATEIRSNKSGTMALRWYNEATGTYTDPHESKTVWGPWTLGAAKIAVNKKISADWNRQENRWVVSGREC